MTEQAAHRLANALINFRAIFTELVDASVAVPEYDISEGYPFYLLDYEEISPAVSQWCLIHSNKLLKQLTYDVPSPVNSKVTVEPAPQQEEKPEVKKTDTLITEELLLVAKILDGKCFKDTAEFEHATAELIYRIGPTCKAELDKTEPGMSNLWREFSSFVRSNASLEFKIE